MPRHDRLSVLHGWWTTYLDASAALRNPGWDWDGPAHGGDAHSAGAGDNVEGRDGRGDLMPIVIRIDVELAKRKMSVTEFAERVGITPANIAVLKNGRAKAVRFSTLEGMCEVLGCQPGDLLEWVPESQGN